MPKGKTRIAFILLGDTDGEGLKILATSRVLDQDLLDRAAALFRYRVANEFCILRILDHTNGMLGSALLPVHIEVIATVAGEYNCVVNPEETEDYLTC